MHKRIGRLSTFVIVFSIFSTAVAAVPEIEVVYPKEDSDITAVDSTFIFGSVTPGSVLLINGEQAKVHKDGGFIAFLPIRPGRFAFELIAVQMSDTAFLTRTVNVPEPAASFGYDSLIIVETDLPLGNLALAAGDILNVSFQATPGCIAYFSIPGYIDSVPMAEMPPAIQPYWGESVFGVGAVPESLKIKGYYSGFIEIERESMADSSRICYYLEAPDTSDFLYRLLSVPIVKFDFESLSLLKLQEKSRIDSSSYFVRINPDEFPRVVQFTDSVQIMRVGPKRGYLSIFQPEGVTAFAIGREGEWLKLKLSQTQYGWVEEKSIKFLDKGRPPPSSYLSSVRTYSSLSWLTVELPLSTKHPYRIEEENSHSVKIYIYGVTSDTDWIRYDFEERNLELVTWSQIEPYLYCLKFDFKHSIWGYDCFYEGNVLKFSIRKQPQDIGRLWNKVIVIDPGHSLDPGAIGPTGLTEAKANLEIALALKEELQKKGAQVVMTREDMSDLPLYDRPKIAVSYGADLFISIHNNALPDGVNPFENNGLSTYYYHPHSIELARSIQAEMLKDIGLNDYGLYYGNLAVNRPTQYPAVLIECAFIILPEQEALLKSEKFQKKIGRSIRKGIEKFLKEYERKTRE